MVKLEMEEEACRSGKVTELPRHFADDAKLRIIVAAEALYAEHSIDSVSFRQIAQAAGNRNTNAVQYHFGDRAALVQAIFAWRVWQMEPARGAALARAEDSGQPLDLATLMRILCEPILELVDGQGRHTYAAFLSKYLLQERPAGILHAAETRPDLSHNLRRILGCLYTLIAAEDQQLGDYRIALSYLVVINMLVLSDNEGLHKRDPPQLRHRFETALAMAVAALANGCIE